MSSLSGAVRSEGSLGGLSTGTRHDAVVVGAGPNGLAAAAWLARAGLSVLVLEARSEPGGGARTQPLTLPGFAHDVCSAVHPLGMASPVFRSLALERYGLQWVQPRAPVAHVLDENTVVTLERSVEATAAQLGPDADAYRRLVAPLVGGFDFLESSLLGPLRWPAHPLLAARFGLPALRSLRGLARSYFRGRAAPALLGGIAGHAMVSLDRAATASFALVLGLAGHAVGWPIARGGSGAITEALVGYLRAHGGELRTDHLVARLEELPPARAYLLDVTPRQLLAIGGSHLSASYRRRLARYRYGPGVFKMDWALSRPIPWRDARCARSATVHLSGSVDAIAASEAAVAAGGMPEHPFVLVVQPTLFDPSRAPPGRHIAWAYCHVPHGSTHDASGAIEGEIERFAPGFRKCILARAARNARDLEAYNPNCVGGDIHGGSADLAQLFFRPVAAVDPYFTGRPGIFLCSSSTPPGGGVHGLCGYYAARSALYRVFGRRGAAIGAVGRSREATTKKNALETSRSIQPR